VVAPEVGKVRPAGWVLIDRSVRAVGVGREILLHHYREVAWSQIRRWSRHCRVSTTTTGGASSTDVTAPLRGTEPTTSASRHTSDLVGIEETDNPDQVIATLTVSGGGFNGTGPMTFTFRNGRIARLVISPT